MKINKNVKTWKKTTLTATNEATSKFDIGVASMGNGLAVYNRAKEERGDYQKVAHIDRNRKITWYVKDLPSNVKSQIEKIAKGKNQQASTSQPDMKVFNEVKSKRFVPASWQKDPNRIKTDTVQFWKNGTMLTAQMPNADAKRMVKTGKAFVISSQAIGVEESQISSKNTINEATITTIPKFNLESDLAIEMLNQLKTDSNFKKIAVSAGLDYFNGGRPNNIYSSMVKKLYKGVFTKTLISKLAHSVKNKKFTEVIMVNSDSVIYEILSKILAQAILFEFKENPIEFSKKLNDSKLIDAANNFSVFRGREKFGTMMKNENEAYDVPKKTNPSVNEAKVKLSKLQLAYREFFIAKLAELGVKSPVEIIGDEKRKEFWNNVKKDWPKAKAQIKEGVLRQTIRDIIAETLSEPISVEPIETGAPTRKTHKKVYQSNKTPVRLKMASKEDFEDEYGIKEALNELIGGKGDNTKPENVDSKELEIGIAVEMEHTNDRENAKEIALDHLAEKGDYYSSLIKSGLADEEGAIALANKYGMSEDIVTDKFEPRKRYTSKQIVKKIGKRNFQDFVAAGRLDWVSDNVAGEKLYRIVQ